MANEFYVEIAQEVGQETAEKLREFFDSQKFTIGATLSDESLKEIQNQLNDLSVSIDLSNDELVSVFSDINDVLFDIRSNIGGGVSNDLSKLSDGIEDSFATISSGISVLNDDLKEITDTAKELNEATLAEQRAANFALTEANNAARGVNNQSSQDGGSGSSFIPLAMGFRGAGALAAVAGAFGAALTQVDDNLSIYRLSQRTGVDQDLIGQVATSIISSENIGSVQDAVSVFETLSKTVANAATGRALSEQDVQVLRNAGVTNFGNLTQENLYSGIGTLVEAFQSSEGAQRTSLSDLFNRLYGTDILNFVGGEQGRNIFLNQQDTEDLNDAIQTLKVEFTGLSNFLLKEFTPAIKGFAGLIGEASDVLPDALKLVYRTVDAVQGEDDEFAEDVSAFVGNLGDDALKAYRGMYLNALISDSFARASKNGNLEAANELFNQSNLPLLTGENKRFESGEVPTGLAYNSFRRAVEDFSASVNKINNPTVINNSTSEVTGQ